MSDHQMPWPLPETRPAAIRAAIRNGLWRRSTERLAPGHVQANLVVLPVDEAAAFQQFCNRNPQPCPVLAVLPPGDPRVPAALAADADIRFDIPRYRIYREGRFVAEVDNLRDLWRDDLVAFLLGCSFGFDGALLAAGLPVRHLEQGRNVPMFRTNRPCVPAGPFQGNLVVTYRPMPTALVERAAAISARYPLLHGAPVQIGDPESLGIADLNQPDWGEPVVAQPDDVPMFWACGVTPQAVALESRVSLMITHAPGHMLVADLPIAALAEQTLSPVQS
ncbi:MAG: putative hydro-lyase [Oscillochloridaceae bacterium]|nr:putative hydro-lyase [Chloroflexaceae bacterium]MDW8390889.1 putative hydro-lyase [Oscillochloridaceae bacterium]